MNAPDPSNPNVRAAIAALQSAAPTRPNWSPPCPCRVDLEREMRLVQRQLDRLRDDVAELIGLVIPEVDGDQ